MASEIRVNKIANRVGLSTVEYTDTGIIVSGIVTCTEISGINALNIAGVSTFASPLDINGDIDVDGHTNLDNLSVAGVSTFSNNVHVGAGLSVVGVSTFSNAVNIANGTISRTSTGNKLIFQTDLETRLFHSSNNHVKLTFYGSGETLRGSIDAQATQIQIKDSGGRSGLVVAHGAESRLYFNDYEKFRTTNTGAVVTGIITATSIIGSGTSGIKLPVGTTAQRENTQGMLRYNSTLELPEYYNGSAWVSIDSPPAINSVSPTEVESASGGNITFTINGARFSVGANVRFISNTGVQLTPSSVTRVSATQLTAVIAKNSFVNGQEPYDVKVINSSGIDATLSDQINVDNAPAWVTSAGSLGSFGNYVSVNVTVSATDADGDTVTYSIVSGSLPSGLSLNTSTGAITGTMGAVGSSTTVNFTLRATAGGKTADRAFSFVQSGPSAHAFTYTGSDQTWTKPSGVTAVTAYVWGGGGSGGGSSAGRSGGSGGYAKAVINVSSLSALYLVVADGGSTGTGTYAGAGGGYSGIFNSSSINQGNAVLIAGAGGGGTGAGGTEAGVGGGGGGANNNGRDGIGDSRLGQRTQGLGGTTSAGGAAGNSTSADYYTEHYPQAGGALYGGRSGMQSNGTSTLRTAAYKGGGRAYNGHNGYYNGGSGGGGYYGGGGGTCGYGGGGGGGSGYANGSVCSSIVGTNGSDGNGTSTTAAPENSSAYYASGVAVGGATETAGGDGRIVLVY